MVHLSAKLLKTSIGFPLKTVKPELIPDKLEFIDFSCSWIKVTRASFLGSFSKIFVSKIKMGNTFKLLLRALYSPLLSLSLKSRLNQKILISSIVLSK